MDMMSPWKKDDTNNENNKIFSSLLKSNFKEYESEQLKKSHLETSVSISLLRSMWKRTRSTHPQSTSNSSPPLLLDLEHHFYDPTTGLHSEGVWHNCMAGIASLSLLLTSATQSREGSSLTKTDRQELQQTSRKIANSLWKYSWDGTSFQRRVHSGLWDHSRLKKSDNGEEMMELEQPNYYKESKEHRCVQHGMAIVFWSMLIRQSKENNEIDSGLNLCYEDQLNIMAKSFVTQFWDEEVGRWHTISKIQGGGTISRSSASSGMSYGTNDKKEKKISNEKENAHDLNVDNEAYYYRAVDQAVGIFACLGMLPNLKQQNNQVEYNRIIRIIQKTAQDLLSPKGFGYVVDNATIGLDREEKTRSYIGIQRNRNFWHDGWALLSMVCARKYIWSVDEYETSETILKDIFQQLIERYGHFSDGTISSFSNEMDGTVWHWATSHKKDTENGNVHYCGDNALLYAIAQNLGWAPEEMKGIFKLEHAFWKFISFLRSRDEDSLASVADVYPQIRLHPNTELAALILWGRECFEM